MASRISLCAGAIMSCLSLSAMAAVAQGPKASVSGPAFGTNVVPSTAVQKEMLEGRFASTVKPQQKAELMAAVVAAGAPGIEGAPDTQSGR